ELASGDSAGSASGLGRIDQRRSPLLLALGATLFGGLVAETAAYGQSVGSGIADGAGSTAISSPDCSAAGSTNATAFGGRTVAIGCGAGFGSLATNLSNVAVGSNSGNYVDGRYNSAFGANSGSHVTGN